MADSLTKSFHAACFVMAEKARSKPDQEDNLYLVGAAIHSWPMVQDSSEPIGFRISITVQSNWREEKPLRLKHRGSAADASTIVSRLLRAASVLLGVDTDGEVVAALAVVSASVL